MTGISSVRNVALVGHNGNGKTSLVEAMLYRAGLIGRPGRVEDGSTVSDSDPEEKERQQSLSSSVVSFPWDGHQITLIDTPGYADFMGDAIQAMTVCELAVFVIDAVSGVQAQDRVLWRHASKSEIPRMIFVNGLDRAHASFDKTLAGLRAAFGVHAEPVEIPIGEGSGFHGIADLITDHAFIYDTGHAEEVEVPPELEEAEHAGHEHLIEEVVEGDDEILEKYLEGTAPTPEEIEHLLHEAVDAATVYPVLCGSATVPIGVDHLMDFICHVGPAPGDLGPESVEAGGDLVEVAIDPSGDPLAYVFKTKVDDFLGQVSYMTVLSGTIKADDHLVNSRTHNKERLHQLNRFDGAGHKHAAEVTAGSIAMVAKLDDTVTGDTLAPDRMPVMFPVPDLPEAVYGIAISAATPAHEDKLATGLRRLLLEDPSLSVNYEPSTRQTVLSGGGETHLRVAIARLGRLGVEVDTEDVKVAYLETLARPIEIESRHKKQSGGHGQFAVATVKFEPTNRGMGFEFDDTVTGGAIPKNLIPAVGAGIEEAMADAGQHGFPVVDLRAVCTDGKTHSVDSSEMAFKMAGREALRSAVKEVGTQVLEPVSELTIEVPDDHQGDVLGDLSSRRAQVLGTGPGAVAGTTEVRALVPTAEITGYAIDLRSMTGGTGVFRRSHHGHQALPAALAGKLNGDSSS